jgi:hypothetical protein
MVASADVIVNAHVGSLAYQTLMAGYNSEGTLIPASTATGSYMATAGPALALAIADYVIEDFDKVIRDCSGLAATPGAVSLRMPGDPPTGTAEVGTDTASAYPMGSTGNRFLFFFSRNPDGTYGLRYGPCSRLAVDGAEVTCSNGDRTQLPFMENLSVAEFMDEVEDGSTEQGCP